MKASDLQLTANQLWQQELQRLRDNLPARGTPVADLTEEQKLAVCHVAGAPLVCEQAGQGFIRFKTAVPVAITERWDGGYTVVPKQLSEEQR